MENEHFKSTMESIKSIQSNIDSINENLGEIMNIINKDKIEKLEKRKEIINKILNNGQTDI